MRANAASDGEPLNQSATRQILRVNHPDRHTLVVHNHQIIDPMLLQNVQHLRRPAIACDGDWVPSQECGHRQVPDTRVDFEVTGEIAMRENARKFPRVIQRNGGPGAAFVHLMQNIPHPHLGMNQSHLVRPPHDVTDLQQKRSPQAAAGVKAREIVLRKTARLQEHHRQRVAQNQHRR